MTSPKTMQRADHQNHCFQYIHNFLIYLRFIMLLLSDYSSALRALLPKRASGRCKSKTNILIIISKKSLARQRDV